MKKTILTLVILASVSLTSFAGSRVVDSDKGDIRFPKELSLSKDQKTQMKEINTDFKQKIKAIKMSRITEEMQQVKIKALREEQQASIEKILTPDQLLKFKEKKAKMGDEKQRRGKQSKHRMGSKGSRLGATWVLAGIEMTDAQREKYKVVTDQYAEDKKKVDEKYMSAINDILTPDQQTVFQKNKESIGKKRDGGEDICPLQVDVAQLSVDGKAKVKAVKEEYEKQKSAVERSRIAPEMQKQKLKILKDKLT